MNLHDIANICIIFVVGIWIIVILFIIIVTITAIIIEKVEDFKHNKKYKNGNKN